MTSEDIIRSGGQTSDPSDRTAGPDFGAGTTLRTAPPRRECDDHYVDIVAVLNPKLRVIRGSCNLQWIIQRQNKIVKGEPIWSSLSFCGSKEGVLCSLREILFEEHLTALGCYSVRREKIHDAKLGRAVEKKVVTREALDATEAARRALDIGDVASFGVDPQAWAIIEALPDYFPKAAAVESDPEKPGLPGLRRARHV